MAWCQGCQRIIVFGETFDGKKIPLDPKAPVYKIVDKDDKRILVERASAAMVSHFSTCPQATAAPWKKRTEQNRTGND